jgi:hypothetical protein
MRSTWWRWRIGQRQGTVLLISTSKPANVFISFKRGKGMEGDEFPSIILGDFVCAVINQQRPFKPGVTLSTMLPIRESIDALKQAS